MQNLIIPKSIFSFANFDNKHHIIKADKLDELIALGLLSKEFVDTHLRGEQFPNELNPEYILNEKEIITGGGGQWHATKIKKKLADAEVAKIKRENKKIERINAINAGKTQEQKNAEAKATEDKQAKLLLKEQKAGMTQYQKYKHNLIKFRNDPTKDANGKTNRDKYNESQLELYNKNKLNDEWREKYNLNSAKHNVVQRRKKAEERVRNIVLSGNPLDPKGARGRSRNPMTVEVNGKLYDEYGRPK
jgi:hypothetical protein